MKVPKWKFHFQFQLSNLPVDRNLLTQLSCAQFGKIGKNSLTTIHFGWCANIQTFNIFFRECFDNWIDSSRYFVYVCFVHGYSTAFISWHFRYYCASRKLFIIWSWSEMASFAANNMRCLMFGILSIHPMIVIVLLGLDKCLMDTVVV